MNEELGELWQPTGRRLWERRALQGLVLLLALAGSGIAYPFAQSLSRLAGLSPSRHVAHALLCTPVTYQLLIGVVASAVLATIACSARLRRVRLLAQDVPLLDEIAAGCIDAARRDASRGPLMATGVVLLPSLVALARDLEDLDGLAAMVLLWVFVLLARLAARLTVLLRCRGESFPCEAPLLASLAAFLAAPVPVALTALCALLLGFVFMTIGSALWALGIDGFLLSLGLLIACLILLSLRLSLFTPPGLESRLARLESDHVLPIAKQARESFGVKLVDDARRVPLAMWGVGAVAAVLMAGMQLALGGELVSELEEFSLAGTLMCWMIVNGVALFRDNWRAGAPLASAAACLLVPPLVLCGGAAPLVGLSRMLPDGLLIGAVAAVNAHVASAWLLRLPELRARWMMAAMLLPAIALAAFVTIALTGSSRSIGALASVAVFASVFGSLLVVLVVPSALWLFRAPADHSVENDWRP